MTTMRAYVMTRYGGPEAAELREVPVPEPGAGELRIRVHAAGLNPVDYKIREGQLRVIRRYPLPIVMGNELAGVVEACGPGVKQFAPGDRVFARVDKDALGAFAEYACVAESLVARMPARLDFATAAAVPLAGLTALQGLRDELHAGPGQRLFIPGGAGGVGTFALQLAKRFGAEVATTASPRGEAMVRRLGADVVVDYTRQPFEAVLKDYDGAFDLVGGDTLTRSFAVVKPGGLVLSIAGVPEPETARKDLGRGPGLAALFWAASLGLRLRGRARKVRYRYLFMHPSGPDLADLARRIDDGTLEVVVDRVVPFAQIGEAFAHLEAGHAKGKVVVRMVD
ncbi:alcohol dehydrogenase [Nannocystis exedens]|uniref:Alcohol dehydrogenase n=2 Tax=Nannocystis exedens TaxID=54 RepID=A0A1I2FLP7_9BACT|nr:NADP-dependent oxidoreductase [Nannocystis exedens]PCC74464.1 alcohol dehydrogenase [Nannocystis exedens]SFF06225.1 alcohol dehydrogenase [Nannocystis exedens]